MFDLMEGSTPPQTFSQQAVGHKAASEICVCALGQIMLFLEAFAIFNVKYLNCIDRKSVV